MTETPERRRVGDQPHAVGEREWETFVRGEQDGPLRHVGSVTAPSAAVAYEQVLDLFGWDATDAWVCPAEAMVHYSTHDLDDDAEPAGITEGGEPRVDEP